MQAKISHVRVRFRLAFFFFVIALLAMHHSAIAQDNGGHHPRAIDYWDSTSHFPISNGGNCAILQAAILSL
jgi:hypothetical protein